MSFYPTIQQNTGAGLKGILSAIHDTINRNELDSNTARALACDARLALSELGLIVELLGDSQITNSRKADSLLSANIALGGAITELVGCLELAESCKKPQQEGARHD